MEGNFLLFHAIGLSFSTLPKSYVFTHRPNPIQEAILEQWGIKMLTSEEDDPQKALQEFLEKLK